VKYVVGDTVISTIVDVMSSEHIFASKDLG
jgi:hypothetical protein